MRLLRLFPLFPLFPLRSAPEAALRLLSFLDLWVLIPSLLFSPPAGYKIPVIENLGATLDQFDAIDFSDNEIRKLDGFPLLRRLKTLLMNNNRIWYVLVL